MARVLIALGVVVVVAGAGAALWGRGGGREAPARASAVASEIAHRRVVVRCAELGGGGCEALAGLGATPGLGCFERRVGCAPEARRVAEAVLALTRVALLRRGVRDAPTRECFALQQMAFAAMRLGAPPSEAQAMAGYVFAHRPAGSPRLPSGCIDDGPLDVDPATHSWPSG